MMPDALATLHAFRAALYACFTRRAAALFDLIDALLSVESVSSPVHLSATPAYRRRWGSFYAALAKGRLDVDALRALVAQHPLPAHRPIYAIDSSVWPRCDAETSPARGYYYHPSRHSAGQPIVAGWAYQWVAQLGFARDSWTAPLDVQRVHPTADSHTVAAQQIRRVIQHTAPSCGTPLFVFDAGYDPEKLARELGESAASVALLIRLRAGRCFYGDPPPPKPTGRPPRHGAKFACDDPTTWPAPLAKQTVQDDQYGRVVVQAWAGLHAKSQNHPGRGTRRTRPTLRGTLIRVEVSRLPRPTREPQALWLWWQGSAPPDLDLVWRVYVRRFDLEHTFRFLKQALLWTVLRPRTPEQADRWTWLFLAAYTQLRLARPLVADRRLPWERPLEPPRLTPVRVRRGFCHLLPALGTPAAAPKPCGRSPGRPKGRRSGPAPRHPAIKKAA
jgi:hypothetical protein